MRGRKSMFNPRSLVIFVSVSLLLLFTGFPFIWMAATAFKSSAEIFVYPPYLIPKDFTFDNVQRLFENTRFVTYFKNSVYVSTMTVILNLIIATPGAYALTRFRFFGREKIATVILFTYMFSPIMIIIPFYVLIRYLGLVNTHFALILAYTAFTLPFSLWMLRTFFQSIPLDLEEAALTDGASRLKAVFYVVLPTALPGVVATSIFTFILAWNDYIFVRILISSDELKTLSVGIADLYNSSVIDWGMIMSGCVLIIVPVVVVFSYLQKYLVAGWGTGGVKG
ncbi:MAG: carbohydrate ABC transporter permease [Rhizobiaceae bacterium]|nr:carbohydrate ABC transporter permease [Rhizobiaceae bacterium]|tara:strand:- start:186342 stop:187184 length:843 start_codon:yes stop_codon:yes gene_type:complete